MPQQAAHTATQRETFYSDILSTAVEGGIAYWAEVVSLDRSGDGYQRVQVRPTEPDSWTKHTITVDTVRAGWNRLLERARAGNYHYPVKGMPDEAMVKAADEDLDSGMVDATMADDVVQLGLFGDLVYA